MLLYFYAYTFAYFWVQLQLICDTHFSLNVACWFMYAAIYLCLLLIHFSAWDFSFDIFEGQVDFEKRNTGNVLPASYLYWKVSFLFGLVGFLTTSVNTGLNDWCFKIFTGSCFWLVCSSQIDLIWSFVDFDIVLVSWKVQLITW